MGFENALKNPLTWMRREPAVFLLAVINWLPGLLLLPAAFTLLPTVRRKLAESNGDFTALITQHGGELLQASLPFLLIGIVVLIASMLLRALVSLALVNAAAQLRQEKQLRLSDALANAKNRWGTLVVADLIATLLFIVAFLACVLLLVLAIASAAVPFVGILLALILGVAFLAALIVSAFGFSAAYQILPAVVAENKAGAWTAVKEALGFVWKFKLQSAGFVLIIFLAQYALGQVGMAGFPNLILVIGVGMLSEMLLQTWTGLYSAEFWSQYAGKPTQMQTKSPEATATPEKKALAKPRAKTVKHKIAGKK
ncbi:hypothetical protein HYV43_01905 [Candidatus Micrarchaeota archaeon]|nr:hypothetical protein [Candidatus Micrarchaeota archaeon]